MVLELSVRIIKSLMFCKNTKQYAIMCCVIPIWKLFKITSYAKLSFMGKREYLVFFLAFLHRLSEVLTVDPITVGLFKAQIIGKIVILAWSGELFIYRDFTDRDIILLNVT